MKFTMHTDKIVASRSGHTIQFVKGEPTHVPKEAWEDVTAAGGIASDQDKLHEKPKVEDEIDPANRETVIMEAFAKLVDKNARDDFSANGIPTTKALLRETTLKVDPKELGQLWAKFRQGVK